MPTREQTRQIERRVKEAQTKAEWYATGILDAGTDSRVGDNDCIVFGRYYGLIAREFYEEKRTNLPNVRSVWPDFIESAEFSKIVLAGVKALDGHDPLWWQKVDLDVLDMRSGTACVAGQLSPDANWADYLYGLMPDDNLDIPEWAYAHGFDTLHADDDVETLQNYERLTILWREAIQMRRADYAALVAGTTA